MVRSIGYGNGGWYSGMANLVRRGGDLVRRHPTAASIAFGTAGELGKRIENQIRSTKTIRRLRGQIEGMRVPGGKRVWSGRSSGFVRSPKRARYYRKKGKGKRKMRKVLKSTNKGVSYQTEYASRAFGDKCIYLGHTTAHANEMFTMFMMACIKKVLAQAGVNIYSWDQAFRNGAPLSDYVSTGDVFQFVYKTTVNAVPFTVTGTSLTVGAGQVTFIDLATSLFVIVNAAMVAGTIQDGAVLQEFQYKPVGAKVFKINLLDSKIDLFVKSALKMQNRSLNAAGDNEADDVNNVPIYGKSYQGFGNGAVQRTSDAITLLAGTNNTVPIAADGSPFSNFSEPVNASELTHVLYTGKAKLEPGQIRTSVLKYKSVITVQTFWQQINQYYSGANTNSRFNLGKFRIMSFERMIARTGETTAGVDITYEVDYKGFMTLIPGMNKWTSPYRVVL